MGRHQKKGLDFKAKAVLVFVGFLIFAALLGIFVLNH